MPTYEYRCKGCSTELEVVQSFTDDPLTTCDACGGELRKVFAAPGISFKGSGFYKTDSRSGSSSSDSGSDDKGGKDGKDGKGDKKDKESTDSKPSSNKKDATAAKSETSSGTGDKATKAPAAASSTS